MDVHAWPSGSSVCSLEWSSGVRIPPRPGLLQVIYAVFPHVRCTYLTNTTVKSSPDGSVVERRIAIRPYRWFHSVGDLKVKRRFCSAVAAMQCSGFTARRPPGSLSGSPGRLPATFCINSWIFCGCGFFENVNEIVGRLPDST